MPESKLFLRRLLNPFIIAGLGPFLIGQLQWQPVLILLGMLSIFLGVAAEIMTLKRDGEYDLLEWDLTFTERRELELMRAYRKRLRRYVSENRIEGSGVAESARKLHQALCAAQLLRRSLLAEPKVGSEEREQEIATLLKSTLFLVATALHTLTSGSSDQVEGAEVEAAASDGLQSNP